MGSADGEGYAFAAARNPTGPVAVIGAAAESYSTAGLLAFEGLLGRLRAGEPPRLADYWLAVERALLEGPMDPLTFLVLDNADGSRGRISLADQRREHVQMWTLLGDPALRMPTPAARIELKAAGEAVAGGKLSISGNLPTDCRANEVRITLERPLATQPADAAQSEDRSADRGSLLAAHRRANTWELDVRTVAVRDGRFAAELVLPNRIPWPAVIARAVADSPQGIAHGTLKLPVAK